MKLQITMIPRTTWGINLHNLPGWDHIRLKTRERSRGRCEICGESGLYQGREWAVEVHEIWSFDTERQIQRLVRLEALCPECHEVRHFGMTLKKAKDPELAFATMVGRMKRLNGWDEAAALQHIDSAFQEWEERSKIDWAVDLSWEEKE